MKKTNKMIIALVAITAGSQIQAMASEAGVAARRGARGLSTTEWYKRSVEPTRQAAREAELARGARLREAARGAEAEMSEAGTAGRAALRRPAARPGRIATEESAAEMRPQTGQRLHSTYQGPAVSRQRMGESLQGQTGMGRGMMQPTAQPGVVTRGGLAGTSQARGFRTAAPSLGLKELAEWKAGGMEYKNKFGKADEYQRAKRFQEGIPVYVKALSAQSNILALLKDVLQNLTSDDLKGSIKAEALISDLPKSRQEAAMAALQDVLNGKIEGSQAAEIVQLQIDDIETQLSTYEKAVELGIANYDQFSDKIAYFRSVSSFVTLPDRYNKLAKENGSLYERLYSLWDLDAQQFISSMLPQLIEDVKYMNTVVETYLEMAGAVDRGALPAGGPMQIGGQSITEMSAKYFTAIDKDTLRQALQKDPNLYGELSKKFHPDVNPDESAREAMQIINEAAGK